MKRLILLLLFTFPLFAQNPVPNCSQGTSSSPLTFTGVNHGPSVSTTTGACAGSITWWLTWTSTGFTGYTIALQGSQDNVTFANVDSSLIQFSGSNPTTWTAATITNSIVARVSLPYLRVNVSSVTGSGTIKAQLLGYNGTLAKLDGGGGGGGGTITLSGDVSGSGTSAITTLLNRIHPYTVGTLPVSPTVGFVAYVTDGASGSDCTTGGGSTDVLCAYTGSAWQSTGTSSPIPLTVPLGGTGHTSLTSNAVLAGNGTGPISVTSLTVDGSGNTATPGSITTGNGSSTTGNVALKGGTSGNTVNVTVAATTAAGTVTIPGVTGTASYVASAGTSGHCTEFATDGIGLIDAGSACGSGGGGSANASCTFSATATGCGTPTSINVAAFGATSPNQFLTQCWTGASTTQTTLAIATYVYTTSAGVIQTIAPTFSAAVAAGYCVVNGAGGGGSGGGTYSNPYVTIGSNNVGPNYNLTIPPSSSWTSINVGTSSMTASPGGAQLVKWQTSGSDTARGYSQSSPGGTWTLQVGCDQVDLQMVGCGIILYDGTKARTYFYGTDGKYHGYNWNTPTSFNGAAITDISITAPMRMWLQVQNNGTNETSSYSVDGLNWIQLSSIAANSFLTPTTMGFGLDVNTASFTFSPMGNLFHFKLTSP